MRYRTHWCGDICELLVGQHVKVAGWVNRRRDHGGLAFIDLRDRSGLVQLVFEEEKNPQIHEKVHSVRGEYVLSVSGVVVLREEDRINPSLPTGKVEIVAKDVEVLAACKTPPFFPEDRTEADETLRLKYRYLDLRRPRMLANLLLRDRVAQTVRRYLESQGFVEVETPILTKSTPEGARDFLVPSRLRAGEFYALPQSPQLFKQLLMCGGVERYYQLARAFRDEDLRADRQPEHTQIDVEMSFVTEEDIQETIEGMLVSAMGEALAVDVPTPFPRLTYADAMRRYGSDKPDMRFGMEIVDVSEGFRGSSFGLFANAVNSGGVVRGVCATGGGHLSRKSVDDLASQIAVCGAKGLVSAYVEQGGVRSTLQKYLSEQQLADLVARFDAKTGDIILLTADKPGVVAPSMGALRLLLAETMQVPRSGWAFLWVVDPPMFEYDEKERRLKAQHHPFTMPRLESLDDLLTRPMELGTYAYDVVLNGVELGSGSLRIWDPAMQESVFAALGLGAEEIRSKFGFLVEAMEYGFPPHAGMALGLDRLVMLMAGESSIREVIAFPKTQSGSCPLTDAPSAVSADQLKELRLRLI